jgi:PAS domain S-box-containing protein
MSAQTKTKEELLKELQKLRKEHNELKALYGKDVTECKQAENALRESKAKYQAIFESTGTATLIVEEDTTILMANNECYSITGYTPTQLIGQKWIQYVAPECWQEMLKNQQLRRQNPDLAPKKYEVKLVNKKGEIRDAILDIGVIPDTKQSVVSMLDITERKWAEEALRTSEEKYRTLNENIGEGVGFINEEEIFVFANPAAEKIFGVGKGELTGLSVVEFLEGANIEIIKNETRKRRQGENSTYEHEIVLKDGSKKNILITATPNFDNKNLIGTFAIFRDITERKITEVALRESEEKYRVLFEGSPQGILAADIETHQFLFSNPAICQLFGYTNEEFQRLSITDLHPKDSLNSVIFDFESQGRGEKPISFALPCLRKDGTVFYADISGTSTIINERKCTVGFFSEATERKLAEESLRLSEEKYRSLFENVQDIFYQIDLSGIIQDISPSIKHFSEFNRDEIIGNNVFNLYYNPDDRNLLLNALMENGEVRDFELLFKTKSGEKKVGSINASLMFDANGKPDHIDGSLRDITDRKQAEDALKESEDLFHSLYDNVVIGIYRTTTEGHILKANPAAVKILGYDSFEQLSQRNLNKEGYEPNYPRKKFLETMESEGRVLDIESAWNKNDGSIIFLRESAVAVKDETGNIKFIDGTFYDITQRKLEREELKIAKEHAEESDRLKSAFLSNMSHEIRTPMNGILGFSQLLKEPDLTAEEQKEFISIIEKSGARLLNIIHDIVNISKIESGQMDVSISATNINQQIEYIHTFFTPEVENKRLQLLIDNALPSAESIIKTDREKLYAILTNLVNNAIKFTQNGSIKFGYEKKGKYLEFFVKDTGEGISDEHKEIIFERFRQGGDLTSRFNEGTGLGLSISKAYVEILGGKIWVESELGKGSIFYFTLPYIAESETKTVIKDVSSGIGADNQVKNLKILVVEDDETSENLIETVFRKFRKEFLKAGTGAEAVEACRKNPDLDLILMDIRMPIMNGYEATQQIRQFNKDVVIIAQTAYGIAGDREKAIEAGCNDYISKPIKIDVLKELMQKYLNK